MSSPLHPKLAPGEVERSLPENPPVVRLWRGRAVESQHRGSWVLCASDGSVLDGCGHFAAPVFARSSVKCLQALPLLETGAADRYRFDDAELALALASHDAEPEHTAVVRRVLARLGLSVEDLGCGPQPPGNAEVRARLRESGGRPSKVDNNCSGKHAGFLALALHLDVPPARYLDPESAGQRLVREAVLEVSGASSEELSTAIDGCSAPTFRLPLARLATAFARVTTPAGLAPARRAACERMQAAVAAHPVLIAGSHQRICTDLARRGGGRLFPKVGGEAVYAVGLRGADRALAIKIDDGSQRALHALLLALLARFEFLRENELRELQRYAEPTLRNWAGLEVGRVEVVG
jgi:L-asparaginase II